MLATALWIIGAVILATVLIPDASVLKLFAFHGSLALLRMSIAIDGNF